MAPGRAKRGVEEPRAARRSIFTQSTPHSAYASVKSQAVCQNNPRSTSKRQKNACEELTGVLRPVVLRTDATADTGLLATAGVEAEDQLVALVALGVHIVCRRKHSVTKQTNKKDRAKQADCLCATKTNKQKGPRKAGRLLVCYLPITGFMPFGK